VYLQKHAVNTAESHTHIIIILDCQSKGSCAEIRLKSLTELYLFVCGPTYPSFKHSLTLLLLHVQLPQLTFSEDDKTHNHNDILFNKVNSHVPQQVNS